MCTTTDPGSSRPLALSKLRTIEDEHQQRELDLLAEVDRVAAELVIAGPVFLDEAVFARLSSACESLNGGELIPRDDEAAAAVLNAMKWSYRVGLMTGLRLARALDGGAR